MSNLYSDETRNFINLFQLVFYDSSMTAILRYVPAILLLLSTLVSINYFGQRIIDRKKQVFQLAYFGTKWYLMPPKIRRKLLMILICSTNCSGLTAGKMSKISLENAGNVLLIISSQFFEYL